MNKPKIILFAPTPEPNFLWTRVPLSVIAAGSLVLSSGIKVVVITGQNRDWKNHVLEEIKDALLFGVTTMTGYQISEALMAASYTAEES